MVAGLLKRAMLVTAGVAFGMALVVGAGFWRARRTSVAEPPSAMPSQDAAPAAPAASTPSSYPAPAVQG
ncbi:MAG TPA: hypothetical protein VF453_23355 [Burkholderiaceae bacterium]